MLTDKSNQKRQHIDIFSLLFIENTNELKLNYIND